MVWPLTPTEEPRSSMHPANHPNRGQKLVQVPPSPYPFPQKVAGFPIPERQNEDKQTDNSQPTWFQLGASQRNSTTKALSRYRGGTNTVSCKMLYLELRFDSTLSNFTFLFISLFILVTSSCQTPVHPPGGPALSPTEHFGSHDAPADLTQATKWPDFTHKDPLGRERGRGCLKLHFRHVHVKLTPTEDFILPSGNISILGQTNCKQNTSFLMSPVENILLFFLAKLVFKRLLNPCKNNFD